MLTTVREAALAYPVMKEYKKTAETKIINRLPTTKEQNTVIGSVVVFSVSGKISTKVIKKMNMKLLGGKIRPDFVYNFKTGETLGIINFVIDFP